MNSSEGIRQIQKKLGMSCSNLDLMQEIKQKFLVNKRKSLIKPRNVFQIEDFMHQNWNA